MEALEDHLEAAEILEDQVQVGEAVTQERSQTLSSMVQVRRLVARADTQPALTTRTPHNRVRIISNKNDLSPPSSRRQWRPPRQSLQIKLLPLYQVRVEFLLRDSGSCEVFHHSNRREKRILTRFSSRARATPNKMRMS